MNGEIKSALTFVRAVVLAVVLSGAGCAAGGSSVVATAPPSHVTERLELAEDALLRGRYDDAGSHLDYALASEPRLPARYYAMRARTYVLQRRCPEGVRWVTSDVTRHRSNDRELMEAKAALLWCGCEHESARRTAERAYSEGSRNFDLLLLLGSYHGGQGRPERAVAVLTEYKSDRPPSLARFDRRVDVCLKCLRAGKRCEVLRSSCKRRVAAYGYEAPN